MSILPVFCACRPERAEPPQDLQTKGEVGFYRFDDHLAEASFNGPATDKPAYGGTEWTFEGGDSIGWKAEAGDRSLRIEGGVLRFDTDVSGSIVTEQPLRVPMEEVRSVLLRARVEGAQPLTMNWRTDASRPFLADTAFTLPVTEPGKWTTFTVPTASLPGWVREKASLESLRVGLEGRGRLELDFLKLVPHELRLAREPFGNVRHAKQNDDRPCLYMRTPGELTFRTRLLPGARFSAGVSLLLEPASPMTCSVLVRDGRETRSVVRERLSDARTWHDVSGDLGAGSGGEVEVVFRLEGDGSGNTVLWSSPIAYRPLDPRRPATLDHESGRLTAQHPNIVWYVIDALRPDHLQCYGYERATAPTVDRLAAEGVMFTRCFAPGTWSLPSVASMLSGAAPLDHGVCRATSESVPDTLPLLAEALRAEGYATGSVSENPHAPPKSGLGRGFDSAQQSFLRLPDRGRRRFAKSTALSEATFEAASAFVQDNAGRPFFLFMHTVEAHEPYASPARYRNFSKGGAPPETARVNSYDDCIRWADANLARFLAMLAEAGVRDNTLLVVCADHGEGFTEDEGGTGHSGKPYFARIRVPLIIHWPGAIGSNSVVHSNVQLLDVPATIMDTVGLPKPATFAGTSLVPLLWGQQQDGAEQRSILALGYDPAHRAWIQGDRMLMEADGAQLLFDLAGDPHRPLPPTVETTAEIAQLASALKTAAPDKGAMPDSGNNAVVVDVVEREQLEALGYVR